jgi:hypothetical protein
MLNIDMLREDMNGEFDNNQYETLLKNSINGGGTLSFIMRN